MSEKLQKMRDTRAMVKHIRLAHLHENNIKVVQ